MNLNKLLYYRITDNLYLIKNQCALILLILLIFLKISVIELI